MPGLRTRRILGIVTLATLAVLAGGVAAPLRAGTATADLSIAMTGPATSPVGSDLTYQIQVVNLGPDPANGVLVTDPLPTPAVYSSAVPLQGSCTETTGIVTCDLGILAPSTSTDITLVVSAIEAGQMLNSVVVSSATLDPDALNGEAAVGTDVQGPSCTVVGTQGDDVLDGTTQADVLCGLGGGDRLRGAAGDDTLYGGTDDDVLEGGPGNDVLDGGEGSDGASYATSSQGVTVSLEAGTATGDGDDALVAIEDVTGSPRDDVLEGSPGANRLTGLAGTDVLHGLGGDDVLAGDDGGDYLSGGRGVDDLGGGPGPDVCVPGADPGTESDCHPPNPPDPNDTRGRFDVRRVRARLAGAEPVWTVRMFRRWTPRRVWDRAYAVVHLDTRRDASPDYVAVIRSGGGGVVGELFRAPQGRERLIASLPVRRAGPRGASIRVPLDLLRIAPGRAYYRWSVQTLLTSGRCRRVCSDVVPDESGLLPQPLP